MDKKECKHCSQIKLLSEFRSSIIRNKQYFRLECKECEKKMKRIKRLTNRKELNLSFFRDRASSLNSGAKSRAKREYIKVTGEQLMELFLTKENSRCYICNTSLNYENLIFDHEIPLSSGGAHNIKNIRCCCQECSSLKLDRDLQSFIPFLFDYCQRVEEKLGGVINDL
ncbi:HNH endonuclease [Sutcliffiella horikoshii]|uniref:HNH endonuclease n=1 Tax=Sutcliffiella horikoshii TaxID=79883 RepID=UPI003CF1691A